MSDFLSNSKLRMSIVMSVILLVGASTLDRAIFQETPRTDFTVYSLAAQAVLDGKDIYEISNVRGWRYVYPPLFAITMVPLAKAPLWLAVIVWYLVSVAAVFHSIKMCVALTYQQAAPPRETVIIHYLPVLIIIGLLLDGIARGQASVLLMWLVIAGIYFERRGAWLGGAACLAGAVSLKVFPLTLLGYFVWKRKWRFTAATLVFIAAGIFLIPAMVFGWHANLALLNEWVAIIGKPAMNIGSTDSPVFAQLLDPSKLRNQSFEAVFTRILPHANAQLLALAVGVIMAIVMLLVAKRKPDRALLLSAALCWMVLISPVAENHYFVLLLLPVTSLVVLRRKRLAWSALVIFFITITMRDCVEIAKFYGALCWGTLWLWLTFMIFSIRGVRLSQASSPHEMPDEHRMSVPLGKILPIGS